MKQNIKGKIRNLSVRLNKSFIYSLYEAISNSIHSIHISKLKESVIDINIYYRDKIVEQAEVIDYAVGFTSENFNTFLESEKTLKEKYGCKGLGRFIWLLAFKNVCISSNFCENDKYYIRNFEFNESWDENTPDENITKSDSNNNTLKTCVKLLEPRHNFNYKQIKSDIVSHFLPQFFLLEEEGYNLKINIRHYLNENNKYELIDIKEYKYKNKDSFELYDYGNKEIFDLYHLFTKDVIIKKHSMLLCAGLRAVETSKFSEFPEDYIYNETKSQEFSSYHAIICSKFLDRNVLPDRLQLSLDKNTDIEEENYDYDKNNNLTPINIPMIIEKVKEISIQYLKNNKYTIKWDGDKENRINQFKKEHAYLSPLLDYIDISWSDTIEKIYNKANEKRIEKEKTIKRSIEKLENNLKSGSNVINSEEFIKAIKDSTNLNSIELSAYVYYRKYALKLLESILSYKNENDKKYGLEEEIHNFLYPRRKDSENTDYESHNLWVIDDRWAFYEYIVSEKELNKIVKESQSNKRPDIVIFSMVESTINSILLIELKRPGKSSEHKNPHKQLKEYVYEINKSKSIKTSKGRTLKISDNVRFYCYILCNTNDEFIKKEVISEYSYNKDADGTFYLHNHSDSERPTTTMQIIDFELLLENAKKRNKAFIEKLPK